ncbi:MAG: hypothetical protein WBE80_04000 [Methylocella sp.]
MIVLDSSLMYGTFAADGLYAESDLSLAKGVAFKSDMSLNGAKIDGNVDMSGTSFEDVLNAQALQVGQSLLMRSDGRNKASFKDVALRGAKIAGQINMDGASFDGALNASGLQVDGGLYIRSASVKDLVLRDGKIAGQVAMSGASFDEVSLHDAMIGGQIDISGAHIDGALDAASVQVGSDILMRDASCAHAVVMVSAHVLGSLDLRGANLAGLDLSGASVARDLLLGGELAALNLRNAHVGNLVDAKNGWPARDQLNIDGFTFDQLSAFDRDIAWWKDWLRFVHDYRPGLYAQVATSLTNSGDRYAANEIRYLGRERERAVDCQRNRWGSSCLILTAQNFVNAYGIVPPVLFRILFWVLGLSLAGAAVLWRTVPAARQHGLIWCFGASLSQLLPVTQLNNPRL